MSQCHDLFILNVYQKILHGLAIKNCLHRYLFCIYCWVQRRLPAENSLDPHNLGRKKDDVALNHNYTAMRVYSEHAKKDIRSSMLAFGDRNRISKIGSNLIYNMENIIKRAESDILHYLESCSRGTKFLLATNKLIVWEIIMEQYVRMVWGEMK